MVTHLVKILSRIGWVRVPVPARTLFPWPGTRYQVPGIRYQVPGTRYQVSGIRYQEDGHGQAKADGGMGGWFFKAHKGGWGDGGNPAKPPDPYG